MFSAILSYLFGPAGHQTYRGLVIGPAGQQTYRAIAILSYLFGATPYRLEMISAILLGLALHLMDSYSFGAIPYGLLFLVSVIVCVCVCGGGGVALHVMDSYSLEIFSGILSGLALQLTDLYLECSKFLAMGLIIFMNYIASCRMDHFMNLADFFAFTYM